MKIKLVLLAVICLLVISCQRFSIDNQDIAYKTTKVVVGWDSTQTYYIVTKNGTWVKISWYLYQGLKVEEK